MKRNKRGSTYLMVVLLLFLMVFSLVYYAIYLAFINMSERMEWIYYGEDIYDPIVHSLLQNLFFYLPVFAIIGLIIYAFHYTNKKKRQELIYG